MPGNMYNNYNPGTPRTRLERLLRDRELWKINRSSSQPNEEGRDGEREGELIALEPSSLDGENFGFFNDEAISKGLAEAARALNVVCERQEGRPSKQRLLVVANRLPVSVVRNGKDSWHLEISVGELVSALLGVKEF